MDTRKYLRETLEVIATMECKVEPAQFAALLQAMARTALDSYERLRVDELEAN